MCKRISELIVGNPAPQRAGYTFPPSPGMHALGIRRTGHVTRCKQCRRKFTLVTRKGICSACVIEANKDGQER